MRIDRTMMVEGGTPIWALHPGQCFMLACGIDEKNVEKKIESRAIYMVCVSPACKEGRVVPVVSLESGYLFGAFDPKDTEENEVPKHLQPMRIIGGMVFVIDCTAKVSANFLR